MNKKDKEAYLAWAEAYFLMSQEPDMPEWAVADGTFERLMWEALFKWAGWSDK